MCIRDEHCPLNRGPVVGVTSMPTLYEWGLLLMACLVGGAGWWQVRLRTTSRWPAA